MHRQHSFTVRWICVLALLGLGGIIVPDALPTGIHTAHAQTGYDRPAGNPQQSRSPVIARHGMVATSHPLAAQAGLDVLRAGGNAIDAAITTNAMLGVVEPMSCGIGGDLFVIYWDAKTQKLYGLNASGRSPYGLNRDIFRQKGMEYIPDEGVLSWSVPGCVDGWDMLLKRFGTRSLAELLKPAIDCAETGFPVTEIIGAGWKSGEISFDNWPDSSATYLQGGLAPEVGQVFRNPNLARSYRQIAEQGRDSFYRGDIARKIVSFSEQHGGYFSLKDFEDHTSEWVEPVSSSYRGYDVWELPPNGQGIAALQMLNVLEGYDLKSLGPRHPDYIHLFVEAKKLAFADRAQFYADPAFSKVPVAELISKAYGDRQRERINPQRAATTIPPGDPRLTHGDTVYLTVVDKDRNCCSFIQSIYYGFGSQVVPGDVGFAMQNRGCLFSLSEDHPNRLEPHKRPFQTIIPGFVTKAGQPYFCFGVMGGDMQPQGHAQVLINMIDFGMNVQEAGDAARIQHFGSASPTGKPGAADGGVIALESGHSDRTRQALEAMGHQTTRRPGSFGGYQGILIDPLHGTLHGGSDPRKDGCAVGY